MDLDALLHPENPAAPTPAEAPVAATAVPSPVTTPPAVATQVTAPVPPQSQPKTITPPTHPDAPEVAPTKPKEIPPPLPETLVRHTSHTYADDLSKAMDTTDAPIVQELLTNAREREESMKQTKKANAEKQWYSLAAALLLLGTLGAATYSVYYTQSLTVPVQKEVSIGVFPTTAPVVADSTDIRQLFAVNLKNDTTLPDKKPFLVNLVKDMQTLTPLSSDETTAFMEATPSDDLHRTLQNIHIGGYNTGNAIAPFIIAGVEDNELATKEMLIAEPMLLSQFYKALSIPIGDYDNTVTNTFESAYTNNIPIRTLSLKNKTTNKNNTVLLYGYVTDNIIVITTDPLALKAVYDAVIRQQ